MRLKDVINQNELTQEMIERKLKVHDITEANFETRLEEILGNDYVLAKELNKRQKKHEKDVLEKQKASKSDFEENYKDFKDTNYFVNMHKYFSQENLNNYFDVNSVYQELSTMTIENYEKLLKATDNTKVFDIFLSHSMKDKLLVYGVYLLLSDDLGKRVYVDWIVDPFLSETRSKVAIRNVRMLQIRMRQSSSLSLLKTINYSISKWVAWEIGYFNGGSNNVFILHVLGMIFDDDITGMGFLKIYRDLVMILNKLVYLEQGRLVKFR